MFVQNPVLGAAAVALYPVQAYVIPKLQRRIRELGRAAGAQDARDCPTASASRSPPRSRSAPMPRSQHQLADISHRLGEIYDIRFEIYNRKFFVKFLNNFIGPADAVLLLSRSAAIS